MLDCLYEKYCVEFPIFKSGREALHQEATLKIRLIPELGVNIIDCFLRKIAGGYFQSFILQQVTGKVSLSDAVIQYFSFDLKELFNKCNYTPANHF